MRIESVTAHAFGPLANATLDLGPGLNVIAGANESAKSSWHAATCVAVVGRRRGKGASTLQERRFADLHKPWDASGWRVSAILSMDDGRRIEISQELEGKVDCRATDLALGRDVSAELMFEGSPDASRLLGLDRRSFTATAVVNQAELLSVIYEAEGLQDHLQRAAASTDADATAAAALDLIERYLSENVGLDRANSTRPLRTAITAVARAQERHDVAFAEHQSHLALVLDSRRKSVEALAAREAGKVARSRVEIMGRVAEAVSAIGVASAGVDQAAQQLAFARQAERSIADRVGRVGHLQAELIDKPRMAVADADATATSVSAALAAFRSVPAVRQLSGRDSDEVRAELDALPEQAPGDFRPDLTVQAAWDALTRAQSTFDTHQAAEAREVVSELGFDVESALEAGPVMLRELAAQLRTTKDVSADPATSSMELSLARERLVAAEVNLNALDANGTRSMDVPSSRIVRPAGEVNKAAVRGLLVLALGAFGAGCWFSATGRQLALALTMFILATALLAAALIVGKRRRSGPENETSSRSSGRGLDDARLAVIEAGRKVAQLEGQVAAEESFQQSAATTRNQLLARAATRNLPTDPEDLLRLAEMAELVTETRTRRRQWESTRDGFVAGLAQAESDLRAALRGRGELDDPALPARDLFHRYVQRCSQLASSRERAALRPRLEAELVARMEAEHALSTDESMRRHVELEVRDAVAKAGVEVPSGAETTDLVQALERWQSRHEVEIADLQRRQERWAELDALLDGATPEALEGQQTVAAQRTASCVELSAQAAGKAQRALEALEGHVRSARECGVELRDQPTCVDVDDAVAWCREEAIRAENAGRELAGAAERADATAAERARILDSVAESEEALGAAEAELARVRELEHTLRLTQGFLSAAQTRVHQDIAPVLAKTLRTWLPSVTRGRYVDAVVDPATLKVRVCGADRRWRDADRLSVGTAEQIYLLLRVALAERLTTTAESCPLLLDDVTVQADEARTVEILKLLLELSNDRQVLIFAQEPTVERWAQDHLVGDPNHRLIQLDQVAIV